MSLIGRRFLRVYVSPAIPQIGKAEQRYLVWQNVYEVADGTRYGGTEWCTPLAELTAEDREIASRLPVVRPEPSPGLSLLGFDSSGAPQEGPTKGP